MKRLILAISIFILTCNVYAREFTLDFSKDYAETVEELKLLSNDYSPKDDGYNFTFSRFSYYGMNVRSVFIQPSEKQIYSMYILCERIPANDFIDTIAEIMYYEDMEVLMTNSKTTYFCPKNNNSLLYKFGTVEVSNNDICHMICIFKRSL